MKFVYADKPPLKHPLRLLVISAQEQFARLVHMASSNDTDINQKLRELTELVKITTDSIVHFHERQQILERSNAQLLARVSKLEEERERQETHNAGNTQVPPQVRKLQESSAGGKMVTAEAKAGIRSGPYTPRSSAAGGGSRSISQPVRVLQPVPQPQNPNQNLTNWQQHYNQIMQIFLNMLQRQSNLRRPEDGDVDLHTLKFLIPSGNFQNFDQMRRGYVAGQHCHLLNEFSLRVIYWDTVYYIQVLESRGRLEDVVGQNLKGKVKAWISNARFDKHSQELTGALRRKIYNDLRQKSGNSEALVTLLGSEKSGMSEECCKNDSNGWWRRRAESAQRLVRSVMNSDPAWRQANNTEISDFGLSQLYITRENFGKWHNLGHPVDPWFKKTTERLEHMIKYFDTRLRVLYLQKRFKRDILKTVLGKEPPLFLKIDRYIKIKEGENVFDNDDKRSITTQMRAVIYDYDPRILLLLCPSVEAPQNMPFFSASTDHLFWSCWSY